MALRKARRSYLRRFARAKRGATAVEFALVVTPFLLLLFGIIELAMVFIVSTTLDGATDYASRLIRTGEFQTGAATGKNDFRDMVCARMSWLSSGCAAKMVIDVRTFAMDDFSAQAADTGQGAATFNPAVTCFSPGGPSDIVLVRAYYPWNLFTPLLNGALQNMGAGSKKRLISAAVAFRNEPYSNDPQVGAKCT